VDHGKTTLTAAKTKVLAKAQNLFIFSINGQYWHEIVFHLHLATIFCTVNIFVAIKTLYGAYKITSFIFKATM